MDLQIIISESEDQAFAAFLRGQLRAFNDLTSPHHRASRQPGAVSPLNLILVDAGGQRVGGLLASTYWNWLEIDTFFIPPELRRTGIGASLLRSAEQIAIQRGCEHCFLSTYSFQARGFYEKQGYFVVGALEGCPPGATYYWMRKDFLPEAK